jgi:hypothetical protein
LGEEGFPRYGIRSTSYWVGTGSKVTGAWHKPLTSS